MSTSFSSDLDYSGGIDKNGVVATSRKSPRRLSKVQKLKRSISARLGQLSISRSSDTVNGTRPDNDLDNDLDLSPAAAPPSCSAPYDPATTHFRSDEFLERLGTSAEAPRLPGTTNSPVKVGVQRVSGVASSFSISTSAVVSSATDSQHVTSDARRSCSCVTAAGAADRPVLCAACAGSNSDSRQHGARRQPPRPKSDAFLSRHTRGGDGGGARVKRLSAFGGDSPFGRQEAYVKLGRLGEGSYATVYKGYSNVTGQVVALKEIRLQNDEGAPFTAIREASLLKQLRHANIVTLHDIVHTKHSLTFVFECVHTDLAQYMERHPGGLDQHNTRLFMYQLLRGLAFCHASRVLHRDLKPQNLLISVTGQLKLADFGLARAKSVPSHTYSDEVVTLWYRPPDVLLGSTEYTTSLDVWAVGCIFIEMLCGGACFPGVRDCGDQLARICDILGAPTPATWPGVDLLPGFTRLLGGGVSGPPAPPPRRLAAIFPRMAQVPYAEPLAYKLLMMNPSRRITAAAALKHRYFGDWHGSLGALPHTTGVVGQLAGGQTLRLVSEPNNFAPAVLELANQLRRKRRDP